MAALGYTLSNATTFKIYVERNGERVHTFEYEIPATMHGDCVPLDNSRYESFETGEYRLVREDGTPVSSLTIVREGETFWADPGLPNISWI